MINWHLITGEYPPRLGGVADYARLVAGGLAAAGDGVNVWTGPSAGPHPDDPGVAVHHLPDHFGPRALAVLDRALGRSPNHRVLVQYVPQAFGCKAMNLPFCLWLFARRRRRPLVTFHEVMFPMRRGRPLRHNLLGAVTRLMALLVACSAADIFLTAPIWERVLRIYAGVKGPVSWIPVPSNIPLVEDLAAARALRRGYAGEGVLLGHFGTYPPDIKPLLCRLLPTILTDNPALAVLLIGSGSSNLREALLRAHPEFARRLCATGPLPPQEVSHMLSACDLMLQPYSDGVSTRRTSLMAAIAHGRPVITNSGITTEQLWAETGAVALSPSCDLDAMRALVAQVVADPGARAGLSAKARELYASRFALRHTIAALRSAA